MPNSHLLVLDAAVSCVVESAAVRDDSKADQPQGDTCSTLFSIHISDMSSLCNLHLLTSAF